MGVHTVPGAMALTRIPSRPRRRATLRTHPRTPAPARAKRMAAALPFPRPGPREPAPVTMATLPARRPRPDTPASVSARPPLARRSSRPAASVDPLLPALPLAVAEDELLDLPR